MTTSEKTCFKCHKTLPLEAFYKHSAMADGHLNKCKECTKADVKEHRNNNLEKVREYDRLRGNLPHRVEAREIYRKTIAFYESHRKSLKKYSENNPHKKFATTLVGNSIRDGKLKRLPCFICGEEKTEAHHPDYSMPLDVVWMCKKHHSETHGLYRKIMRSKKL